MVNLWHPELAYRLVQIRSGVPSSVWTFRVSEGETSKINEDEVVGQESLKSKESDIERKDLINTPQLSVTSYLLDLEFVKDPVYKYSFNLTFI